jgi:hypothetical protein
MRRFSDFGVGQKREGLAPAFDGGENACLHPDDAPSSALRRLAHDGPIT